MSAKVSGSSWPGRITSMEPVLWLRMSGDRFWMVIGSESGTARSVSSRERSSRLPGSVCFCPFWVKREEERMTHTALCRASTRSTRRDVVLPVVLPPQRRAWSRSRSGRSPPPQRLWPRGWSEARRGSAPPRRGPAGTDMAPKLNDAFSDSSGNIKCYFSCYMLLQQNFTWIKY